MKKLKLDLNDIGELLSKEQMKMVTGGTEYATYVQCNWEADEYRNGTYYGRYPLVRGAFDMDMSNGCQNYCNSNPTVQEGDTTWTNHSLVACGYY